MVSIALQPALRAEVHVSPQLVTQSILLELSLEELEERIEEEAERNPALVVVRQSEPSWRACDFTVAGDEAGASDLADWVAAPCSAREDILVEFHQRAPKRLHRMAEAIISALDDRGYFCGDLSDLAAAVGCTAADAEDALYILQRLDPPGLGARSLAECLEIQIECLGEPVPPGLVEFVRQCLHGGPARMRQLAKKVLGLSEHRLEALLDFIRTRLRPYPAHLLDGAGFAGQAGAPPAMPDVVLRRVGEQVIVSVPQSERLRLRLDRLYEQMEEQLRHRRALGESERRIRENVRAARELIHLVERRGETLALVAEAVVAHQLEYFLTGDPQRLKPLDQKTIARATGLHESTVCRTLKNKHLLLPDGALLPFEVLFDESLPAKVELHRLVANETPSRPFSDDELAVLLAERGYPMARRTVTKYRLQLSIPAAHARRRAAAKRSHASRAA
ncbi:MAG: hypothetical protein N2512_09745 [Armatimonadetes bacterium]|nr:hypothetical protein [Armatimonadota bacterium]